MAGPWKVKSSPLFIVAKFNCYIERPFPTHAIIVTSQKKNLRLEITAADGIKQEDRTRHPVDNGCGIVKNLPISTFAHNVVGTPRTTAVRASLQKNVLRIIVSPLNPSLSEREYRAPWGYT